MFSLFSLIQFEGQPEIESNFDKIHGLLLSFPINFEMESMFTISFRTHGQYLCWLSSSSNDWISLGKTLIDMYQSLLLIDSDNDSSLSVMTFCLKKISLNIFKINNLCINNMPQH